MSNTHETPKRTFAMHQPNYIPWLGYFYKMMKCDVFVYLDTVQFPRGQSFANRNQIKTPNGVTYLTIPISVPSGSEGKAAYTEVEFANDKWARKHLKTVHMSYARAPFYEEIYSLYEAQLDTDKSFVELNIGLIEAMAQYLDIGTERIRLSELLDDYGQKTRLIIDIAGKLGADTYLSGEGGGREYNDEEELNEHGITLSYTGFRHPEYQQLWGEFQSHLSTIDLLFNCGSDSADVIVENETKK